VRRATLFLELHRIFGGAVAQARAGVHHHAQAVVASELFAPLVRMVAIENAQEFVRLCSREHRLHFARECYGLGRRPCRQQSRMDQHTITFQCHQRPGLQPVHQGLAVGGGKDGVQGVAVVRVPVSRGYREQVEVMVAQHAGRSVAQRHHLAQHFQRARAAVDEITHQPQPVFTRGKTDQRKQLAELGVATLDVADGVERHVNASGVVGSAVATWWRTSRINPCTRRR